MKTTPLPLPNVSSSSSVPVSSTGMGTDLKKELSNPHIVGLILELADIKSPVKSPHAVCSVHNYYCFMYGIVHVQLLLVYMYVWYQQIQLY